MKNKAIKIRENIESETFTKFVEDFFIGLFFFKRIDILFQQVISATVLFYCTFNFDELLLI